MKWTRIALTSASLLAFPVSALATVNDHYTMQVDTVQSTVQYEIDSNLGTCDLGTTADGALSGSVVVVLHPGAQPISDGQYDGGQCSCAPDLLGSIPNPIPGLPPLLQVSVGSLVLSPHSPVFQPDSSGQFLVDTNCDVTGGTLSVVLNGGPTIKIPILGLTSDSTRSHGQFWIDDRGIHLVREFGNSITVDQPSLNLNLVIGIRGVLRADMSFPVPTSYCPATPNSTGQPAEIVFAGTPSVSRNDGQLLVSHCPAFTTGLSIVGDAQTQVSFGNGYRCVGGQLLRLHVLQVDANGAAAQPLDIDAPPVAGNLVAGSSWNFQFVFRDVAAGGALFDTSDATAVEFVP